MKKHNKPTIDPAILRKKAEELMKQKPLKPSSPLSEFEALKLFHELEVHKIELEMQNEELLLKANAAELAAEKYSELYKFAPSGYFTLSREGEILELNQRMAIMLGKERSRLLKSRFGFFVSEDSKPAFNLFVGNVFSGKAMETCELTIAIKDNLPMHVHLSGTTDETGEQCFMTAIDISEHKRAEEKLAKSRIFLNSIIENSPNSLWISDEHGTLVRMNQASRDILRLRDEEVVGKYNILKDNLVEEQGFMPLVKNVFEKGETVHFTLAYNTAALIGLRLRQNVIVYLDVHISPIINSVGKVSNAIIQHIDITEQKQAEAAILESEVKYKTLFEGSTDAILILDGYKFIECNQKAETIFKCKKENIIGHTILEFSPSEQPDGQLSIFKANEKLSATLANQPQFFEWKHLRLDGGLFDSEVSLVKVEVKGLPLVQAIVRDITERKKIEADLEESKEKYKAIYDNAPLAYQSLNEDGIFIDVNPEWIRTLGYKRDEVIGKYYKDFLHPDWKMHFEKNFLEFKNRGYIDGVEFKIRHKNGHYLDISFDGIIGYHPDGSFKQSYCVFQDITKRKHTEQLIKHKNEELQKINATKDKFFSIIAHDLRGPFSSFMGFTQIMAEELLSMSINEVQEITVSMKNSATNLYNLLDNLLKWAQMQKGDILYNPEPVSIESMLDEIFGIMEEPAKKKGIEIRRNTSKDLSIIADKNMLQTVIRNLISNAVKFTKNGGKINVSVIATGDRQIEIAIQDTGIGMSQSIIDNLFHIEVQTSRKGTEGEASTGLGLILCKEFIEKHGGRIWVKSKEGKGTTFYFTLPCPTEKDAKIVSASSDTDDEKENEVKSLKILIAEDDEISGKLISKIVKRLGDVTIVRNGVEAVEACRTNPDLVLMDVRMPKMNGYEATRQIRKFNSDMVIIAQTAYAHTGERKIALEAGCNDYIAKPIQREKLIAMIQKYFRN